VPNQPKELPELRPDIPCQRCGHNLLIQTLLQERSGQYSESLNPLGATLVQKNSWFDPGYNSAGILFAYICQKCGFTEIYTANPEEIPIDQKQGTRLIKVEKSDFQNI
jgi:hypothetical protein